MAEWGPTTLIKGGRAGSTITIVHGGLSHFPICARRASAWSVFAHFNKKQWSSLDGTECVPARDPSCMEILSRHDRLSPFPVRPNTSRSGRSSWGAIDRTVASLAQPDPERERKTHGWRDSPSVVTVSRKGYSVSSAIVNFTLSRPRPKLHWHKRLPPTPSPCPSTSLTPTSPA